MTKIEIPVELKDKIQKADIKRSATRDLILHILANEVDIPEGRMEMLNEKYTMEFYDFERAKGELEEKYIIPTFADKNVNWNLDYSTSIVTVMEDGE